jgi:hypothetical protein
MAKRDADARGAPEAIVMTEPERWLVVLTDGRLWLHEGPGADAADRIVTRVELTIAYPGLHRALLATDQQDCPRVVVEK